MRKLITFLLLFSFFSSLEAQIFRPRSRTVTTSFSVVDSLPSRIPFGHILIFDGNLWRGTVEGEGVLPVGTPVMIDGDNIFANNGLVKVQDTIMLGGYTKGGINISVNQSVPVVGFDTPIANVDSLAITHAVLNISNNRNESYRNIPYSLAGNERVGILQVSQSFGGSPKSYIDRSNRLYAALTFSHFGANPVGVRSRFGQLAGIYTYHVIRDSVNQLYGTLHFLEHGGSKPRRINDTYGVLIGSKPSSQFNIYEITDNFAAFGFSNSMPFRINGRPDIPPNGKYGLWLAGSDGQPLINFKNYLDGSTGIGQGAREPQAKLHVSNTGPGINSSIVIIENESSEKVFEVFENGQVAVGATSLHTSAIFEANSTTQGMLPPRMNLSQRDAIASPAAGLTLYCLDCTATDASTGVMQTYNGSVWKNHW